MSHTSFVECFFVVALLVSIFVMALLVSFFVMALLVSFFVVALLVSFFVLALLVLLLVGYLTVVLRDSWCITYQTKVRVPHTCVVRPGTHWTTTCLVSRFEPTSSIILLVLMALE